MMAWIKMIDESEAEGLLAELYRDANRLKRPYPVAHSPISIAWPVVWALSSRRLIENRERQ